MNRIHRAFIGTAGVAIAAMMFATQVSGTLAATAEGPATGLETTHPIYTLPATGYETTHPVYTYPANGYETSQPVYTYPSSGVETAHPVYTVPPTGSVPSSTVI